MLHTSRETKNTKDIRIGTLADLRRLVSSLVHFNPFDALTSSTRDGITARAHPRKYFPNSDKAPRCIIRCARPRAANKFLSNTTGILLSSFRRAVTRKLPGIVYSAANWYAISGGESTIDEGHIDKHLHYFAVINFKFPNSLILANRKKKGKKTPHASLLLKF